MLAIVSPAKKMDFDELSRPLLSTDPDFFSDTKILVKTAQNLSQGQIQQLMSLSDSLAELNFERFKVFKKNQTEANAKQAVFAFAGDTYNGLDAASLTVKDLSFAQDHLRILSGLYGLLRPLDLIQPYRLEMGRKLNNDRGSDLYEFWGDKLTQKINSLTRDHKNSTVINLASNEYFKSVNKKTVNPEIVTPVFKELKGRDAKVIGFLAKKARGTMARFIIQNRIENPADLKLFSEDRYEFNDKDSNENSWVFTREFMSVKR